VNEAEGYRNEVLPGARAEAAELTAQAEAHREAVVADATGEAARFQAIAEEYRKAPSVTEKRLYLETMEQVLPKVEKVIIEPGTTNVVPYLPLGRAPKEKP
jgi:membrane protease subunit HflK